MKTTEELKELLYKNATVADAAPDALQAAQDFCEGYKTFLDNAKTEREAVRTSEKLLLDAGYKKFVPGEKLAPGTKVYTGMIVGRSSRPGDIDVNVCKKKHLTSIRNAAGAEEALKITNVRIPTLEEALEFIAEDELVEITPKSIRMRKRVLNVETRKKLASRASK